MPTNVWSEWTDCKRLFPYRDFAGRWVLVPHYTQSRRIIHNGKTVIEYRERSETDEEYWAREWLG